MTAPRYIMNGFLNTYGKSPLPHNVIQSMSSFCLLYSNNIKLILVSYYVRDGECLRSDRNHEQQLVIHVSECECHRTNQRQNKKT